MALVAYYGILQQIHDEPVQHVSAGQAPRRGPRWRYRHYRHCCDFHLFPVPVLRTPRTLKLTPHYSLRPGGLP
jgi:hypothetical protein